MYQNQKCKEKIENFYVKDIEEPLNNLWKVKMV